VDGPLILPISTKWTATSHFKAQNTKLLRHADWNQVPGLGQAQKCGVGLQNNGIQPSLYDNWISNYNTDINEQWKSCTYSLPLHSKMNDNINMDSTLARSVNAWCSELATIVLSECMVFRTDYYSSQWMFGVQKWLL
jgi:hypothetical protein